MVGDNRTLADVLAAATTVRKTGIPAEQLRASASFLVLPKKQRRQRLQQDLKLNDRQIALLLTITGPYLVTAKVQAADPPAKPASPPLKRESVRFCHHRVMQVRCCLCQPDVSGRYLYVTRGGTRVHTRPDCPNLVAGQRKVENRSGNPENIEALCVNLQ